MSFIAHMFTPNASMDERQRLTLNVGWGVLALLLWWQQPLAVLPDPMETVWAFGNFWPDGTVHELFISLETSLEAIGLAALVSLGLAYLSVIPAVRPVSASFATLRFLSLDGITLVFLLVFGGGHLLKVCIIAYGISVFLATDMVKTVQDIPQKRYDHARTLGMGPWRVMWEVVILGTLAHAFDSLRINAAMGWMMLPVIEGISRSEGGIGIVLANENRHLHLPAVFAIMALIYCTGRVQDFIILVVKGQACPYAKIGASK